jgi:hypothetical protein
MSTTTLNRTLISALLCIDGAGAISQIAMAQGAAPVIDSVTLRKETERYEIFYPEFHFHDPSGSTQFLHRELIATDSTKAYNLRNGLISISPDQQAKGATYVGRWRCGADKYYVTIQAFMMNLAGLKSNVVEYTIHCNGG